METEWTFVGRRQECMGTIGLPGCPPPPPPPPCSTAMILGSQALSFNYHADVHCCLVDLATGKATVLGAKKLMPDVCKGVRSRGCIGRS